MTDTWKWANVTQASPLRIKVEGEASELDATTDNLVGSLAVDDRVRVHLHSDGIIVTGLQGGVVGTTEATAATPNTLALRDGDGQLKAADGVAEDDVATVAQLPNPNLLINSDFMVNQEGNTSGASVAAYAYFLDGWYNASGYGYSAGNITWADVGGVRTLTIGVAGSTRYTREKVEASNTPAGMYTLSWEGTAQGQVMYDGGTDPGYSAGPITVYLNGTATVIIGFRGTGDTLRNVKLEQGTVATPYQPPKYDDNLRACQWFYQRQGGRSPYQRFGQGVAVSSTLIRMQVHLSTPMRKVAPTLTTGNVTIDGGTSMGAITVDSVGDTIHALAIATTGLTIGRTYEFIGNNSLAAFVAFDARL